LEKASTRVNFGNGGEVENLISRAKSNYQKGTSALPPGSRPEKWVFGPEDFDPKYDRGKSATVNLRKLFSDVVGCKIIVQQLEGYQKVCLAMKSRGLDPRGYIPSNFCFKGPPGTGKTTTARKIAQVYYDMGFLSEASVIECSASDLVGKYMGYSCPKTAKMFERALGKLLFIDEACRLAQGDSNSSFNSEVLSELVDLLTKPKFHGKLIVILAGYEEEMNYLLSMNPGLASRFPDEINFKALAPLNCLQILKMKLGHAGITMLVLDQPNKMGYKNVLRLLSLLAATPSWGNARHVERLAKTLSRHVFASVRGDDDQLVCHSSTAVAIMENMVLERRVRPVPLSSTTQKKENRGI
jgi:SpoVK/Ycf46/Vps4 family AAA+-type ATPase